MLIPTPRERLESALAEPDTGSALFDLARALKEEGMSQLEMYQLYDEYRAKLQDQDSASYDDILDTMDGIVGWGRYWLFDQELDRTLYDKAFMKSDHHSAWKPPTPA